jgi:hypothetical protein
MDITLVLITLVLVRLALPFTLLLLFGTIVNRRHVRSFG